MVQELRLGSRIPRGLRLILWHRGPCVLIGGFFFQLVYVVVVFYSRLDIPCSVIVRLLSSKSNHRCTIRLTGTLRPLQTLSPSPLRVAPLSNGTSTYHKASPHSMSTNSGTPPHSQRTKSKASLLHTSTVVASVRDNPWAENSELGRCSAIGFSTAIRGRLLLSWSLVDVSSKRAGEDNTEIKARKCSSVGQKASWIPLDLESIPRAFVSSACFSAVSRA
jgi:hypothetical protein